MKAIYARGLFFIFITSLYSEEPHHTTAFVRPCDNLVSYSRYSTAHFWNKKGKKLPAFNYFDRNCYLLYSEFALNDINALFLNGGYSTVKESMNGSSQAVTDALTGWKHLFYKSKCSALSGELTALIPLGDKKSSIRYGKWGIQIRLLYSMLLSKRLWIDSGIGCRFYEGFPSDQLRSFVAIGYQLPSVTIIATAESHFGFFNGNPNGNRNNIIFDSNYRLIKAKIECTVHLMKTLTLTMGTFRHLWGQNCGAGGGYFCGTWIIF